MRESGLSGQSRFIGRGQSHGTRVKARGREEEEKGEKKECEGIEEASSPPKNYVGFLRATFSTFEAIVESKSEGGSDRKKFHVGMRQIVDFDDTRYQII